MSFYEYDYELVEMEKRLKVIKHIERGFLAVVIAGMAIIPVSYNILYPTKKCVVRRVDADDYKIYAQDIKTDKLYMVHYGCSDVHAEQIKHIKTGDVINCVGPRNSNVYYFPYNVKRINGIRTQKYIKQQQKTR